MTTTSSNISAPETGTSQVTSGTSAPAPSPAPESAMRAARPPVGTGSAPLVGLLIALALVALGVLGVQEALVRSGAIDAASWTSGMVSGLDGITAADWMLAAFVAAILLGLVLLGVVFRPRPRKALALRANTGVYLRTSHLAQVAEHLVEGADGVTEVSARSTRRKLLLNVTTVEPEEHNDALQQILRDRLAPSLDDLAHPPKVSINVRNEDLT